MVTVTVSFNTASGKNCCNLNALQLSPSMIRVSILQAVRTVATVSKFREFECLLVSILQAVRTVATRNRQLFNVKVLDTFQYCKR